MKKRIAAVLTVIVLSVLSLCMITGTGYAQKSKNSMKGGTAGQPAMTMRSMTNKQRWAAAVNHANRRAAKIRTQRTTGVK